MNRRPIVGPYGGGNLWVSSMHLFAKENGIELQTLETFDDPDVILVGGLDASDGQPGLLDCITYKEKLKNEVKIILRLNENDARKGTSHVDELVKRVSPELDSIVYVSEWLQRYFHKQGIRAKHETVIKNGVDREIFKPSERKFLNGKVNIISSHWSDNYLKGQDITEWLDAFVGKHSDDFTFTFLGRTKANLKHSRLLSPMYGLNLANELARYDLCINGSRNDPGPNSVIEPIASGLPTYVHSDGGGGVEFAGVDHVFKDIIELQALLESKQYLQNKDEFDSWDTVICKFANHLKSVAGTSTE